MGRRRRVKKEDDWFSMAVDRRGDLLATKAGPRARAGLRAPLGDAGRGNPGIRQYMTRNQLDVTNGIQNVVNKIHTPITNYTLCTT
jgi:hypothetical protein